jgi:hypothetical protein
LSNIYIAKYKIYSVFRLEIAKVIDQKQKRGWLRHFGLTTIEIANKWNSIYNLVAFPKCIYVLKPVKKWLNVTKNYKILV